MGDSSVSPPVPQQLIGCWRRAFIRFDDGTVDDTSDVIWLQTASAMADLRLDGDRPDITSHTGFGDCSDDDLVWLAGSDSSSGFTLVDASVTPLVATWHTGPDGVDYQPMSSFPEPGLLSWPDSADVMIEVARSGAYVEEWRRVDGSVGASGHVIVDRADGSPRQGWYVVGNHAMYVRDRAVPPPVDARVDEVVAQLLDDMPGGSDVRRRAESLVDCEFSYARLQGDRWVIELSTLPWRCGMTLDMSPMYDVIETMPT